MAKTPRGILNNNPGNIRKGEPWAGLTPLQPDKSFCTFVSPAYGIRAMLLILQGYLHKGFDTVPRIVDRWAPPVENDTGAYVKHVCSLTGIKLDERVGVIDLVPLARAIIQHENGQQPYDEAIFMRAAQLANLG